MLRLPLCGQGGVAHFDGVTWSRYLQGRCIDLMDIAADGSVWLLASEPGARTDHPLVETDVYVITPEAVAGTE
jgi:hypothetical protein